MLLVPLMVFCELSCPQLLFPLASDRWFPTHAGAGIGAGSVILRNA